MDSNQSNPPRDLRGTNPVLFHDNPRTIERSVPKRIKLPTQLLPALKSPPDKSLTSIPVLLARQVSMAALLDPS